MNKFRLKYDDTRHLICIASRCDYEYYPIYSEFVHIGVVSGDRLFENKSQKLNLHTSKKYKGASVVVIV